MKTNSVISAAVLVHAVLLIPILLSAQTIDTHVQHHHYKLIEIGTLGGPSSNFNNFNAGPFFDSGKVQNKRGVFAGWANTPSLDPFPNFCFNVPDCYVSHAVRWNRGVLTDLGALVEGWGSDAMWINDTGDVVGISQNGVIDPLTGFPEQRAVLWSDGLMRDLGTLGGNQSAAFAVNNHGQIAGLALNTTSDPFSIYDLLLFGSPNGTQTRAVLWDRDGSVQDLGTLGGPDAYALLVNEHGQVAGWSYTNSIPNDSSGLPTFHPFLWEKGKGMKDLGTLGGTIAQAVNGMNESGEVVGSTTLAGDQTNHPFLWDGKKLIDLGTLGGESGEAIWLNNSGEVVGSAMYTSACPNSNLGGIHAFLWKNGTMTDLGTTDGIANSEADFINDSGQIVGNSFTCGFSDIEGFLWEKGSIVNLNTLISPPNSIHLNFGLYIDHGGEIFGLGNLPDGDQRAFLLIPCDENHPGVDGCDYSMVNVVAQLAPRVTDDNATRNVRAPLWRRNGRFRLRAFDPNR